MSSPVFSARVVPSLQAQAVWSVWYLQVLLSDANRALTDNKVHILGASDSAAVT